MPPPWLPLLLLLPPPPWALPLGGPQPRDQRFQLEVQSSVAVPEGLCAHVPCSVSYPPDGWADADPALGYWFREGAARDAAPRPPVATNDPHREVAKETRGRFQLLGDPRTGGCSLVIRDVRRADAGTYFFRVERGSYVRFNYIDSKLSLEVTDRRQVPDIYMPEALEPGRPATLLCVFHGAFEGCPAPTFSWRGAAADGRAAGPRTSHVLSELTFTPRAQDHGTELTCRVDFSGTRVSAERTVRLNVAHAPKDLVINVSWAKTSDPAPQGNNSCLQVWRGQFLRLSCEADGQPPATLGWVLNDRVLARSPPSGSRTLELELPRVGPGDGGRYTCRAENRLGSLQAWLDLSVQYPPENLRVTVSQANRTAVLENFESGMSVSVLEGESLRLVCVADSNPLEALSWARGRPALSPSQPSGPGVLELPRVQKDDEGEFTCRAQNSLGSASISVRLVVFYPPQLRGPACSWEGVGLRCGCSARAWPAPSVRWRVGDELLEANSSNASVTVTSSSAGPWANSSLRLRAGLSPGRALLCEAQNGHGAHSATVLLVPDAGAVSTAFSKGSFLGLGIATLLFLCVTLILIKTLRKKWAGAAAVRPRASRGSSVCDYVNVDPNAAPQAQIRKGTPGRASQPPASGTHPAEPKNRGLARSKPCAPGPGPGSNPDEVCYADVNFLGLRPWETHKPQAAHTEYAEIKFH